MIQSNAVKQGSQRDISRKDWIDALRALAMIFVIYGHQVAEWKEYFVITSPVKIPLFFAVTGYVFHYESYEPGPFFRKMLRRLVIPWIVISILPHAVLLPKTGFSVFMGSAADVLLGVKNWYMPCCIIAEIIWFYFNKYKRYEWQLAVLSFFSFAAGLLLYRFNVLNEFMFNRSLTALFYIWIGYLYKLLEAKYRKQKKGILWLTAGTVIYVIMCILTVKAFPGQCMDVHTCTYYNLPICITMILIGTFVLFYLAEHYIHKYPRWVTLIGKNTLVIYLLQSSVAHVVRKAFGMIHIPLNRITGVFVTIIVISICTCVSILIKRFIPELLGQKRRAVREAGYGN